MTAYCFYLTDPDGPHDLLLKFNILMAFLSRPAPPAIGKEIKNQWP